MASELWILITIIFYTRDLICVYELFHVGKFKGNFVILLGILKGYYNLANLLKKV